MEQKLIYYVDQYLDGQFVSRSEPCFDRESCEDLFFRLNEGNGGNMNFKMNVSMPLKDYEDLVLSSQKIRIRFVDREPTPVRPNSPTPEPSNEAEAVTSIEDGPKPEIVTYSEDESDYNYLVGDYSSYEPPLDYEGEYDLEPECEPASLLPLPTRKAYKTKGGYVIYNNKKNREFLLNVGWDDLFEATNSKKLLFLKKGKINDYDLNFFDYFREVKMSKKVREIYYSS